MGLGIGIPELIVIFAIFLLVPIGVALVVFSVNARAETAELPIRWRLPASGAAIGCRKTGCR